MKNIEIIFNQMNFEQEKLTIIILAIALIIIFITTVILVKKELNKTHDK